MDRKKIRLLVYLCIALAVLLVAKGFSSGDLYFQKSKILKNEGDRQKFSIYYLHKKSFYKNHGQTADIVMVGDSITDEAEWHELYQGVSIVNRGVSGDTTAGVLNRMDSIVSTKARSAFLLIGINDIARGIEISTIRDNYLRIIDILLAHDIKPYILSTLLVGKRRAHLNNAVKQLNLELVKIAASRDIVFLDLNPVLAEGGVLAAKYSLDDLHLNGLGYLQWKRKMCRDVASLFQNGCHMSERNEK